VEPEGLYRLCKKLDDDQLGAGVTRSKPVRKSRKDRRKVSVVSVCSRAVPNICIVFASAANTVPHGLFVLVPHRMNMNS